MDENQDVLDSIPDPAKKIKGKSYYQNRTIIYIVGMLGIGLLYSEFIRQPIVHVLIDPFLYTITALVTATPIEAIRKYRRDKKRAKKTNSEPDDPFWFHIIESALSLWIIVIVLVFILSRR